MKHPTFACLIAGLCVSTAASASSRIELNESASGQSLVLSDHLGPQEIRGKSDHGSSLARGQVATGSLKAAASTTSTTNQTPVSSTSFVELRDTIFVDAGRALDGAGGFAVVRVDYEWSLTHQLGAEAGLSGAAATGDMSLLLNNQGGYAREYRYWGSAYAGSQDVIVGFSPLGDSSVAVRSLPGSFVEIRVPITFGQAAEVALQLSTTAQSLNGTSTADASHSAYWGGVSFLNGAMQQVQATAFGTTGVDYTQSFTPAVPEPGTWAMLLCGMTLVGSAVRRRKKGNRR